MKKTMTTAAAGLALLAFPVMAAEAKPGKGHGHGHGHAQSDARGGDGTRVQSDARSDGQTRSQSRGRGRGHGAAKRCSKMRKVGFAVRGSLASFTPDDVTVTIARANRHARSFIEGAEHTFALDGARVKFEGVTDADGSGEVDFADVVDTDVVKVVGKITRPKKGCTGEGAATVRKVHVERPEPEVEEPVAAETADES